MKRTKQFLLIALVLVLVLSAFTGCGGSTSKFAGNWVCENIHSGYPDQMALKSDGTGTADGFSCNWSVSGNQIMFSAGMAGTYNYTYSFKGSTLYLDGYGYTKK